MTRGEERLRRVSAVLRDARLDALICTVPENVLLLSGYWPVLGTAAAVATREGQVTILVPEDERDLAAAGWAAEVRTYRPGSLAALTDPAGAIVAPLARFLADRGLAGARLGYEDGALFAESSYAAMFLFQARIQPVLAAAVPDATLHSGAGAIATLRSTMTLDEVAQVRLAAQITGDGYLAGTPVVQPGRREPEIANAVAAPISVRSLAQPGVTRAGAFTWCMSGPNSALAGAAYARTRNRELQPGDLVLIHCNSYLDGYWTDITRTYCLGEPSAQQLHMYDAIFAARAAALATIAPGVPASAVDAAARRVLTEHGFGEYFTHGLGHNVGFSSISAEFPPRLHPASPDRLAVGMTFNVEPAIYIPGYGGIRHCDVVTLGEDGPEVLTPFQSDLEELILPV